MPTSRNWIIVDQGLKILADEITWTFARSSGAGGQNVNKVSSKAILSWNLRKNQSLPTDVRDRFQKAYSSRLSLDGNLQISCDVHRDRARNKAEALDRLLALIASVARPPKPRVATKPTRGSKLRRLSAKAKHGEKKRTRTRVDRE